MNASLKLVIYYFIHRVKGDTGGFVKPEPGPDQELQQTVGLVYWSEQDQVDQQDQPDQVDQQAQVD